MSTNGPNKPETPLSTWAQFCEPWGSVHIDYSQSPDEKNSWLVIADVGTKWIEVYPVQRIKHIRTTPYHSRSNGYAERAIRTIKDKYVKLNQVVNGKERLNIYMFWYRNTIQHSSLRSPAESMMGLNLRCLVDNFKPSVAGNKIWIKNETKAVYHEGEVVQKTTALSYLVSCDGKLLRKRGHQTKERIAGIQEVDRAQKAEREIMVIRTCITWKIGVEYQINVVH
ncbi:hypothetical protein RF11_15664 [Thelohanellus kitauei]|uniref:Integrase catalytic domain-containing protein n=1 Tax=Thelohanellus kitauei TaxID=669202 RepID=A0A0C2N7H0_THEKT|nr:hypothetical protein RF11_15664 [Thelohanellus kitauei]